MKHNNIKFDILLVTYNRPKLLKHTLDCLSMQTYKNFVVHLVDNGSLPPVDQNNLPDDLDIIFTRFESNQNPSDAGQAGIKNTKGTHFLWIADDDVLVTSALQIIADIFESDSAIEAISSGFSKFDHEDHIPLSNKIYLSSFMGTIQKVDAFQAGLGYCNSWGIGNLAHYPLPRMSHSSAFFFSQSLIERTVRKQGELLIKPFSDVGFVGCCFNTKNLYYLDLPLVILGESKFKEMHGYLPGNRMKWQREVSFLEYTPLKACSFVNMGMDSHLKVLYKNKINQIWDCSLRSDFFIRHLQEVVLDDPWNEETHKDIKEALPLAIESLLKQQYGRTDDKARVALEQDILDYLKKYALQVKEKKKETEKAENGNISEFPSFSDIVDFAVWQDRHFIEPIRKGVSQLGKAANTKITSCGVKKPHIPITFLVMVYNEEHRIRNVLDHAVRWADEVIVVNKSSTDKTKEICLEYGDPVRVVDVPFSPKGHDDIVALSKLPGNDWIFFGTASEIPTRKLINRCREILSETDGELDLVYVPRKIFSFGIHSIVSPWSVSYYPFLLNRKKAIITNTIHFNFRPGNPQNTRAIEFSDDCCVYHPTHKSAKDYLKDMTDYFEAEAASCTNPDAKIQECFANIGKFEKQLREAGEPLFGHYLAWPIYWLGTALFVWEKKRGMDVAKFYKNLSDEVIKKEWLEYDDKKSSSPSEDSLKDFKIWQNNRPVSSEDDLLLALKGRPVIEKIKVLYVVGAHKFQEKELFLRLFPNLEKIYLFEPIPHLFASLKTMLQDDTRFEVFPYAISDKNESSIFHVTNNEASSSLLPLGKHKEIFPHVDVAQKITVECKKLENAIAQHHLQNPDMLFLDVQGAEYKILSSLSPDMRSKIYLIYTEASKEEVYVGAQPLDKIETLLASDYIFLGFAPLTNWTPTHGNALFISRRLINLIKDNKSLLDDNMDSTLKKINELCNSGKFEETRIALKQAIETYPDSPEFLNLYGILKLRIRDAEGAKSILLDLINRWPAFAPAYQNIAAIFLKGGDYESASRYFEEALKLDKNNRVTILAYGNMLMGNKKYAKAKEVFGNYLNATPNDSEIQALLQKCEGILGKVSKLGFVVGKIK